MKIRYIEIKNFRGIKKLSWYVKGDFNCIIGAGDTCKTSILTAIDYVLSPRTSLAIDDSDFYLQDVEKEIIIQVTLTDWDENQLDIKDFFKESKFGQWKCGVTEKGPVPEPHAGIPSAITVSLRIDKSLEPKWFVIKGSDEGQEGKSIYAADRAILGVSRIDMSSDTHFTWGRNTILTRLSNGSRVNLNTVISELARSTRQSDISSHQSVMECQTVAGTIKLEAQNIGVKLNSLSPRIDIQKQSMTAGAISLHDDDVPLRNKGAGSKKLISCSMQMQLSGGKNIALIDEIETGLEPHRIRGLIFKLKKTAQQIFTTTHSPVVIRELKVKEDELYVCKRSDEGIVSLESLGVVPDIQGQVRTNAEAFLGSKIIGCEGPTEIGCLRAYDLFRFDETNPPVWSLGVSYFNCGGASKIKSTSPQLIALGYKLGVFCDDDAHDQLSSGDVNDLETLGIHVCQWDTGNSIEDQLFHDVPWQHISGLLDKISECQDSLELATMIELIRKNTAVSTLNLTDNYLSWAEDPLLRKAMGNAANKGGWIKRIDYASEVFSYALPLLPSNSSMLNKLNNLWNWIQHD